MALSLIAGVGNRFQMFRALRYSNFRWFWLNGAAQAMARGMQLLTVGVLVLDITGSSYEWAGLMNRRA